MTQRLHTPFRLRRAALALAAALPLLASGLAQAADAADAWPSRPVRVVVPYGPGGAVDVATRKMAQMLSTQTGQSFIVENKPGATGTIGVSQVARAAPDGYTLVANDTTYSLLPHIFKQLPFDPAKDLQPVSAFVFAPMALAVSSDSPYRKLDDLIAQARAKPDLITYGSGGPGTTPHFAAEGLALATQVKFMHVPFKGAAEATQAVLGKVIDFQFASTTGVMGAVQGGQLRLLAVSGDKRLAVLPDVPTFTEAGVKDFGVVNWTGLWAPKGTPAAVTQRLQSEIAKAMASDEMQTFATKMGAEPRAAGTAEFSRILADSGVMWGNVARNIGYDAK
ncbi:tripartite tricarboxylate transporter substrate binding protein [Achromobacter mucicolens]|uniref:Tripartite tricarboxylate transporter substrate binding protein n=1 Tax=Achromobacter mucicolens TaxID=1389922 RepID=A0ABD4YM64_9BURK|nr:tripartite tricarboxylate transporter substrate binding protein [Achromobacter mucicolens]MCP2515376.1 tripartite tricarboxylate transporter substrate binding protein [Achromobacter mucicolens]MDH1176495.1 tripartite tricarboxylate transporter substrate binding protein [Achromobacter mucicolens]